MDNRADRDGWRKVRLGEIGRVAMCKRVLKDFTSSSGDIPFYKIGTFGGKADAYISTELYEDFKERYSYPVKGNVLISAAGTIGKVVVFDGRPSYFQDSNIVWLEHDGKSLLDRYLYYFLLRHEWQITQGATIQRLYNDDIRNTEIEIPPLPIQRKIAEILGAYDDLIENNRRRIALLEKMARELYRERFVRRAKSQMITMSAEEWFGDISIGKTPPRKHAEHFVGDVPWISIADMGRSGMFVFETSEHLAATSVEKLRVKVVPPKTLLMSFKLTVGRLAITTCECCTNEAIAHFRVGEEKLPYMYLYLSEYEFQKLGNTCAISDGINSKIVKAMPIDLPKEQVLAAFNDLVMPLFNEMYFLAQQNRNLARQRDRLLPRLLSGRLEVCG